MGRDQAFLPSAESAEGRCPRLRGRRGHRRPAWPPPLTPPPAPDADRRSDIAMWRKWSRWGVFGFTSQQKPQPIVYAAAFDPDGFKRASNDMVAEAKINLRLHSWFSRAIVEDGAIKGVICESKEGRQAILGKIIVDATGDLDVAASAGAPFIEGAYIVTTVFRLGGGKLEEAQAFESQG